MCLKRCRGIAPPLLIGAVALLAALAAGGCGSSGRDVTARVRGVDFSVNGGTTGALVGNGTAVGGDLTFGQSSPYLFIGQGVAIFAASTNAPTKPFIIGGAGTTPFPAGQTFQLNNGAYYSAYVIGRTDVIPLSALKPDPRFLQCVAAGDKGAAAAYQTTTAVPTPAVYAEPPSGDANIRILNAAPDAGPVDVLIGGKTVFTNAAYPLLQSGTGSVAAVNPTTIYLPVPAGALSVQINAAGTATALVPATTVSVSAGQSYTLVATEPTVAPSFGLSVQADQ